MDSMVKYLQRRIVQNKINKGFPIGNYKYDLKKLREEVNELEKEIESNDKDKAAEEAADVIIMTLGIIEQLDPTCDMMVTLLKKMEKIEKRVITKLNDEEFTKKEGQ